MGPRARHKPRLQRQRHQDQHAPQPGLQRRNSSPEPCRRRAAEPLRRKVPIVPAQHPRMERRAAIGEPLKEGRGR